jgi:lipoprotein-anchoring transpeptidase ErfK/SrfK
MRGFGPDGVMRGFCVALVALSLVVATGCTSETSRADAGDKRTRSTSASPSPTPKPITVTVTPADKATGVATSGDIQVAATNGTVSQVAVTGADGKPVPGALAADGKAWTPAVQLAYGARYTVAVTAAADEGEPKVTTSTFTTMAKPSSSKIVGADLYFSDGDTVGVGMPLIVEFSKPIPPAARAAVERRLLVTTTPVVAGSWHWFGGSEVHYRGPNYWVPGTKITLRAAIGGLPMGNGKFGKRDRLARITVGSAVVSKINNQNHTMTVFRNGKVLRTIPVSLGKRSTPSSSGIHVVMEKRTEMVMDSSSYGLPITAPGGYRTKVYSAVRYTWGGEFTHGAPWSVGDQGRRNVSHGCVNMAPSNARWFHELSKKGDVIEIIGTGRKVQPGNGWTDWNIPWPQYVAGSALH